MIRIKEPLACASSSGEPRQGSLKAKPVLGFGEQASSLARPATHPPLYAAGRRPRKSDLTSLPKPLPTIRLEAGNIETAVDEVQTALIKSDRGLYQRSGLIVCIGQEPALAAHGYDVVIQRIVEVPDHALREHMSVVARFERFDERAHDFVPKSPPMELVKTLKQRVGRLRFSKLTGIVNTPTMRADGSLLINPGYDPQTGLLFDPLGVVFPEIKDHPTKKDAEAALATLNKLIASFPFVEERDRSVALSAILTACVRRTLPTAPMHAFNAPVAGSGKSKLVDIASVLAFGHEAAVLAQGYNDEELEKRLGSSLLYGDGAISIDNCGRPLGGDLLCQMMTSTRVRHRILGKSEAPDLSTNIFVTATGNNLRLIGDLTRRAVQCRLDAKTERPELRKFDWEPVGFARTNRSELIVAVLTILRAFCVADRPTLPPALGSFEAWSNLVRGALLWLGCADPVSTMDELREADPQLDDLRSVVAQWQAHIGSERVTVADVVRRANECNSGDASNAAFRRPDFREALLAVAGQGGAINSKRLGHWLSANQSSIVNGVAFRNSGERKGAAIWSLRE